jgi:TPP-dependent pyruvate/acetoin dehydrogenase alpha subunit
MPSNVLKLIKLCSLFSEATIETDMAKRIMLSIIPHVMTKDENYQYKGTDYKALRAAVHGARDLIKYGSKACVVEMSHYGNNGGNSSKEQDQIYKAKQKAETLWNANDYKSCLKLCTTSFNDVDHWAHAYGGHK